jgi:undecaprenyl diphosphate synthase
MNSELPNHVALILDGNRRWAKAHHMPTIEGHRKGAETIRKIIRHLVSRGVHTITIWIFSTENWQREKDQVSALMKLFEEFAGAYLRTKKKKARGK